MFTIKVETLTELYTSGSFMYRIKQTVWSAYQGWNFLHSSQREISLLMKKGNLLSWYFHSLHNQIRCKKSTSCVSYQGKIEGMLSRCVIILFFLTKTKAFVAYVRKGVINSTKKINRDFAFFVFERTLSQPRHHLLSKLAMQRLSSETTSCPITKLHKMQLVYHSMTRGRLYRFVNGVSLSHQKICSVREAHVQNINIPWLLHR